MALKGKVIRRARKLSAEAMLARTTWEGKDLEPYTCPHWPGRNAGGCCDELCCGHPARDRRVKDESA